MKITRDVPKSITKSLIPPIRNLISEQYLTPWSGDVELAQSFCAKGDGVTGYVTASTPITGYPFAVACKFIPAGHTNTFGIISLYSTTVANTYLSIRRAGTLLRVFFRIAGTSYALSNYHNLSVTADSPMTIICEFESKTVVKIYVNSIGNVETVTLLLTLPDDTGIDGFSEFVLSPAGGQNAPDKHIWSAQFNRALSSAEKTALFADDFSGVIWNATTDSCYSYSGNLLDLIGTRHLTKAGTVDLYSRQDSFHYNIVNGFDLWFRTGGTIGTESDYIWVPYVAGVGVVDAIAGFTLQSSHPKVAFKNDNPMGHNGCETALRFPAGS